MSFDNDIKKIIQKKLATSKFKVDVHQKEAVIAAFINDIKQKEKDYGVNPDWMLGNGFEECFSETLAWFLTSTSITKRYLVFISADYVRDATAFTGSLFSECENIHAAEFDDFWEDISGSMLVMDTNAIDEEELWKKIKEHFPNADRKIFDIICIK